MISVQCKMAHLFREKIVILSLFLHRAWVGSAHWRSVQGGYLPKSTRKNTHYFITIPIIVAYFHQITPKKHSFATPSFGGIVHFINQFLGILLAYFKDSYEICKKLYLRWLKFNVLRINKSLEAINLSNFWISFY